MSTYEWSGVYLDDLSNHRKSRTPERKSYRSHAGEPDHIEDGRPDQIQFFCLEDDRITIYLPVWIAPHAYGLPILYPLSEIMDLIDTG